jgi:hypothetical protein
MHQELGKEHVERMQRERPYSATHLDGTISDHSLTFQKAIDSHNQEVYFTRRMTHISAKTSKRTSNCIKLRFLHQEIDGTRR